MPNKPRFPTLAYALLTLRHKWFVFLAGLHTGAPLWNLLVHDLSKFGPSELRQYGRQFYGAADRPLEFTRAWLHHQSVNAHHWEYHIPRTGHDRGGYPGGEPLEMPEPLVREMCADWLGASRTYEGRWPTSLETWPWWQKNFSSIRLHPQTRALAEMIARRTLVHWPRRTARDR